MINADRDNSGKFAPGNKLAVGHAAPHARKVRRLYYELIRTVTADDIRAIAQNLVKMAKGNNVKAIRAINELFDRLFGRPVQFFEADVFNGEDSKKSVWFSFAPPAPKVPTTVLRRELNGEAGQVPDTQQSENSHLQGSLDVKP